MEDKTLLFIGEFLGAGTGLTKNILNPHSEIYINGEMPFLHKLNDAGYFADRLLQGRKEREKFRILDAKINYGEKLITTNFNKWKNQLNNIKLKKIKGYAYSTLRALNYDLTYADKQIRLSGIKRFYYYGAELISMIFVGNTNHSKNSLKDRFKKIVFEIKKRIN